MSLLEFLVVLAITGLLVGLILPAVQAVRVKALEISNCNNLKQIDLATIHFAETNTGVLPGRFAAESLNYPAKEVFVLILPFLEQSALYSAFTGNPLALLQAPKAGVGMYFNPLDPTRSMPGGSSFGAGVNVRASYAENFCVFNDQPTVMIPDGNSNTIFFAEHYSICGKTEFLFPLYTGTNFANRYSGQASPSMSPLPTLFSTVQTRVSAILGFVMQPDVLACFAGWQTEAFTFLREPLIGPSFGRRSHQTAVKRFSSTNRPAR